jgi:hypothetical protein
MRKDAGLVGLANGLDQSIQAVCGGTFHLRDHHPFADPPLQCCRCRGRWDNILQQPDPECRFRLGIERPHPEGLDDVLTMATSGAATPIVAVECRLGDGDLVGKMRDYRRREVAKPVGEPSMKPVKGELRGKAETAGRMLSGQQLLILRAKRPVFNELLY